MPISFSYSLDNATGDSVAANKNYILDMLSGFLENDIAIKELAISVQKAKIASGKVGIQNGIGIDLTTGTLVLRNVGEEGATFEVSPSIKVSAPLINNTSLSLKVDAQGNKDDFSTNNTTVSLSTAIISSSSKRSNLSQIQADRALKEAEQALKNRSLEAEKDFYKALSAIFTDAVSMLTLQDDAYTKEIELKTVKLQGFTEKSIRYRTVLLEVEGKRRDGRLAKRELERKIAELFIDCGIKSDAELDLMPKTIVIPETFYAASAFSLQPQANFANYESAVWAHYIGELSRESEGQLELKALGGFTLNNTNFDNDPSANAGLSLDYKGITLTGDSEIPLNSDKKPVLKFSLGIKLNDYRIAALDKQLKKLNKETELLAIQKAQKNWEQTAITMDKTKDDLIWEKKEKAEQFDLYKLLQTDTVTSYKQGLIDESSYKNAISNALRAQYQCILTDIKILDYLIDYKLYFVDN